MIARSLWQDAQSRLVDCMHRPRPPVFLVAGRARAIFDHVRLMKRVLLWHLAGLIDALEGRRTVVKAVVQDLKETRRRLVERLRLMTRDATILRAQL